MSGAVIAGVGMTPFGKQIGRGLRSLASLAIDEALADANISPAEVQRIFFGNAVAGIVTQQEMIRGQVALRLHDLAHADLINIENACASGGSAFQLAFDLVNSGAYEVIIAVGAEQLNHQERWRPFNALRGSTDIEDIGEAESGATSANSLLMDFYAGVARKYLDQTDATVEDFARVAVKNRANASLNPLAHLQKLQTVDEVLNGRMIVPPLTLPMCSPTTDGAAAVLVCSRDFAKKHNVDFVDILSSKIASGAAGDPVGDAARKSYEASGLGPDDLNIFELHDAAAPAELIQYEEIGLASSGEGASLIRSGATMSGGASPVNMSGGLLSRGHPLGATGCAQIVELATQLRGRAGKRQIENVQTGMAINGGGWLDGTYALAVATILQKST